jgi:outer membrane biosynthesis protein TonB
MPTRAEQRRLVWGGKMRKTTGGLTRDDLVLNRHGRIVSKRKSQAASKVNNLGNWLRNKGQKFGEVPQQAKKGTNGKPKKLAAKVAAKAKPKPKPKPKVVPKKKVVPKPKPKPKPKKKKLDSKKTVNLLKKAEAGAAKNSRAGKPEKAVPKAHKAYKPHIIDVKALTAGNPDDWSDESW